MDADVIVVGAGLAGLVATHELTRRGKKVALLDQENAANLGGQTATTRWKAHSSVAASSPAAPPDGRWPRLCESHRRDITTRASSRAEFVMREALREPISLRHPDTIDRL